MLIRITERLKDDIFGQFKGKYLDNEIKTLTFSAGEGNGKNHNVDLSHTNNIVTLEFMNLAKRPNLGDLIEVEKYILMPYAKNPNKGVVVVITAPFKMPVVPV